MAFHHNLSIDYKKFELAGFLPEFNRDQYDELLAHAAPDFEASKTPTVHLAPWQPLTTTSRARSLFRILRRTTRMSGVYDSRTVGISVFMQQDAERANRTLAHETWHWAEDVTGADTPARHRVEGVRRLAGMAAILSVADVATYFSTYYATEAATGSTSAAEHSSTVAISIGGLAVTGVALRRLYAGASREERAREFAADPTIVERFGEIISIPNQAVSGNQLPQ